MVFDSRRYDRSAHAHYVKFCNFAMATIPNVSMVRL